ncbi:uncharacterized protein PFL1_01531 [Pseudozyma flocculosa PF-1]|uniref:VHS domain-containing protein n=1 Tax=Pseudozyma flocculosa TaxID=84751 RepID=A0A5C3EXS9_9BASI|nr:uncharacterized protein PFL1_01531 [Pseudozyma flocculosa PF-1]EPQ30630.1 hypothetical protein PFL1_01531 [Pseudozyma flocculosa PF-1]SPO37038.1 uncharacterized protein PSFLO_02510 [Pseudozyma flocculosa]
MKRLFKPKDANVITPLPLGDESRDPPQLQQRDYLPPSPSPFPSDYDFRAGQGAQPGFPPDAESTPSSRRQQQRHSSHQPPIRSPYSNPPLQSHRSRDPLQQPSAFPAPQFSPSGRPQSYQLFDAGPQPRPHDGGRQPFQQHQHHPSAPSNYPVSPRGHPAATLVGTPTGNGPAGRSRVVGQAETAADAWPSRRQSSSGHASGAVDSDRDTDSDDESAYRQSRVLNSLVPRTTNHAAIGADPDVAMSGSGHGGHGSGSSGHARMENSSSGMPGRASQPMGPHHSNQGSVASRTSVERPPWNSAEGRPPSSLQRERSTGEGEGVARRGALGMRRWRSTRKQRDQASVGGEGVTDGYLDQPDGEAQPQRSSWRFGRAGGGGGGSGPTPAAYPVYAGQGEEGPETLLSVGSTGSRDRRLDPAEPSADRKKGRAKGPKKLFGFGSDGKESKGPAARVNGAPAAGPEAEDRGDVPYHSYAPDARPDLLTAQHGERLERSLPPTPSSPQPAAAASSSASSSRKDHWYDRKAKKKGNKLSKEAERELEGIVTAKVGWLCAQQTAADDWEVVLSLAEAVSYSEAASKEAARALRKEFKYGTMPAQKRAARVWAVLTMNSSDRFKLQIASKRFLDVVEETISSPKTPLSVKETMLRVLGVLAYEFRTDSELSSVTRCWNKVKPSDRPIGGEALSPDLEEFSLAGGGGGGGANEVQPSFARQASNHEQWQPRSGAMMADMAAADADAPPPLLRPHMDRNHASFDRRHAAPSHASGPTAAAARTTTALPPMQPFDRHPADVPSPGSFGAMPTLDADVRKLHEECQIARSNANVLIETMLNEGMRPDTLELIDEFHRKAVDSQEFLMSQVPWASAQADRSRDAPDQERAATGAAPPSESTWQERLLSDLLESHGRCVEAARMVDEARQQAEADEEERRVTELSKVEVRVDRSALVEDAETGELYYNSNSGAGRRHAADDRAGAAMGGTSSGGSGINGAGYLGAGPAESSGSRSPSPYHAMGAAGSSAGGSGGRLSQSSAALPSMALPTSPTPSQQAAFASSPLPHQQPRVSRPLPVPGSDRSSSHGHDRQSATSQASYAASSSAGSINGASGGDAESAAHSRQASSASSLAFASRNPYASLAPSSVSAEAAVAAAATAGGAATNPFARAGDIDVDPLALRIGSAFNLGPSPPSSNMAPPTRPTINTGAPQPHPPPLPPHPRTRGQAESTDRPRQRHGGHDNGGDDRGDDDDDDDGDSILTPIVPSEKALGKRRQVSVRLSE